MIDMTNFLELKNFKRNLKNNIINLKQKKEIKIWLSWWNSLDIFLPEIIKIFQEIHVNIRKKIIFWFVDERIVTLDSPQSNYKNMFEKLFKTLIEKQLIQIEQIKTININAKNIEKDYTEKIWNFDIALFWVGPDSHIASLFPNHKLLKNDEKSFIKIKDSPKQPSYRITISSEMIKDIQHSYIFFIGDSKKQAIKNFLDKKLDYQSNPCKLVKTSKNYYVITNLNI